MMTLSCSPTFNATAVFIMQYLLCWSTATKHWCPGENNSDLFISTTGSLHRTSAQLTGEGKPGF